MMKKIKVIFRKYMKGDFYYPLYDLYAFFPEQIIDNYGNMTCYVHVGQHGTASKEFFNTCKPAKPEEYAELLKELQSIYTDCEFLIRKRI